MLEAVKIFPSIVIYVRLIFALYLINSWHTFTYVHIHMQSCKRTQMHTQKY